MDKKLFIEAIVVGIVIVVIGSLISYLMRLYYVSDLPDVCKNWNKNYAMEICLFLTGFFGHLIFEYSNVNKWYCENGRACQ